MSKLDRRIEALEQRKGDEKPIVFAVQSEADPNLFLVNGQIMTREQVEAMDGNFRYIIERVNPATIQNQA